jgi:nucleoside-diphosphate-sugar epimerase
MFAETSQWFMRGLDSNLDKKSNFIHTEAELEDRLSQPSQADVAAMQALEGDLMILGAAGKMGPSLARLARRACSHGGITKRIIAAARFSNDGLLSQFAAQGIETIRCDLLDTGNLASLPDVANIVFMAARKFGTSGSEYLTWAMNTYLPGLVAERFRDSRIVAFSTGNVYPLSPIGEGGATESTPVAPIGEYAQSALGRERMFEYASQRWGTPVAILRLNYANDLRYGVLLDIASAVYARRPVNLRMGLVNVIWQGDANSLCLRALAHCQSPPNVLNITGPETLSVRYLALEFGRRFGVEPMWEGEETQTALLNVASKAHQLFGYPSVTVQDLIDWTAHWVSIGGVTHSKPTHFDVRDGKF